MNQEKDGVAFVDARVLERSFSLGDQVYPIAPLTVRQVVRLTSELGALFDVLLLGPPGVFERLARSAPEPDDLSFLMRLLMEQADPMLRVVQMASNVPAEVLDGMTPDRLLELVTLLVEVNGDFFVRSGPVMAALVARFKAALPRAPSAGLPPSSSS